MKKTYIVTPERPCPHCGKDEIKMLDWNEARCMHCSKRVKLIHTLKE